MFVMANKKKALSVSAKKATKKASAKIVTFEEGMKAKLGAKWKKLSEENRQIIREMSGCQNTGRPIGSAPIKDYES
jgi:hypothetical protein